MKMVNEGADALGHGALVLRLQGDGPHVDTQQAMKKDLDLDLDLGRRPGPLLFHDKDLVACLPPHRLPPTNT